MEKEPIMQTVKVEVPVLLIGFNRPDLIKQNIENLRHQHVQKLYITIDGPREGRSDDAANVEAVRNLVKSIDFCSNVHLKIREKNVGCEVNVSEGIAWALENEDYVIVLEDDVMAHESFFRFMQEMLILYKDDDRIAMVSGCNYTPIPFPNNEDYCFCQSGHTGGGWATWKRVWGGFSLYEEIDEDFLRMDFLNSVSVSKAVARRRKRQFKRMLKNGTGNNTWDVMFSYYRITRHLLSIVPRSHLTSNVGVVGLHYSGMEKGLMLKIDEDFVVHTHPKFVEWNKDYDLYHFDHYLRESILKKVFRKLKKETKKIFDMKHLGLFKITPPRRE